MTLRAIIFTTVCGVALNIVAYLPANAAIITDTVTGTVSVSESVAASNGGPTISPSSEGVSTSVEVSPATVFSTPPTSFTLSPQNSCFGSGCSGVTETDTITVTFTGFQVNGNAVPTFTETGTFTAKYSGSELSCAVGDGVSPSSGETDCLIWTGAANSYNGSTSLFEPITGLTGDSLEVNFTNATDWNIHPDFQFAVTTGGGGGAPIPEPGTLAILGMGLFGMAAIRRYCRVS